MTHRQTPPRKSSFFTLEFALEAVRDVRPLVTRIGKHDSELHSQLKRALTRCVLALGEGARREGGNKRLAFRRASGEANEALTALRLAAAWGYFDDAALAAGIDRLDHLVALTVRLAR